MIYEDYVTLKTIVRAAEYLKLYIQIFNSCVCVCVCVCVCKETNV